MPEYELIVVNDTSQKGTFCLYQPTDNEENAGACPVAWFTKSAAATSRVYFRWQLEYNFVWGETGKLSPGGIFDVTQIWPADLDTENQVTLTKQGNAFTFDDPRQGQGGAFTLTADATTPPNMLSVGIGMSGAPTMIVQAMANTQTIVTPRPRYRVAFGEFKPREIFGPDPVPNAADIEFPPNIFSMTATFNINYTWTVEVNPLPLAMEIPPPPEAQL